MRAYPQLFLAHLREFSRDKSAVFWNFAFIGLFALGFGVVARPGSFRLLHIGFVPPSGGAAQAVVSALQTHELVEAQASTPDDGRVLIRSGSLDGLVVFENPPEGSPRLVLEVAADQGRASVLASVVGDAVRIASSSDIHAKSIEIIRERLEGPEPSLTDLFVPGLLAMLVMRLGLFNTPHPIISLRIQGIARRLQATPVSPWATLAAHLSLRFTIVVLQVVLVAIVAYAFFGLRFESARWGTFIAVFVLSSAAAIALGLVIASVSRTQETGNAIGGTLQIPLLLLSGILVPVSAIPRSLRPLAFVMPTTHIVDAFGKALVGATPLYGLGVNMAVLSCWLLVSSLIAARSFSGV